MQHDSIFTKMKSPKHSNEHIPTSNYDSKSKMSDYWNKKELKSNPAGMEPKTEV